MKLGTLKSIGHNIADSVASGIGLMIGVYGMDMFGEAASTPEAFIEVDFLTGETSGGEPSPELRRALKLYADALPELCRRHGVEMSDIRHMSARFSGGPMDEHFIVTVEAESGRRSVDTYVGRQGRKPRVLDHLGRIRKT